MGFKYVIGLFVNEEVNVNSTANRWILLEHMEEDEETSRAVPKWVELEYKVRLCMSNFSSI